MYHKMYAILCGAASDAIDALLDTPENQRALWILRSALRQAEELYLETQETEAAVQSMNEE